jgi:DNA-binding transcriptional MerR regulator
LVLTLESIPGCRLPKADAKIEMRSGELARLSGVSSDTLRHYERLKLLTPPLRTPNGYRDYSPESLRRVQLIRRALKLGFSLPELQTILRVRDGGGAPCQRVRDLAMAKRRQVDQQIADLLAMRKSLDLILKNWSRRLRRTAKGQPSRLLETLPPVLGSRVPSIPSARQTREKRKSK